MVVLFAPVYGAESSLLYWQSLLFFVAGFRERVTLSSGGVALLAPSPSVSCGVDSETAFFGFKLSYTDTFGSGAAKSSKDFFLLLGSADEKGSGFAGSASGLVSTLRTAAQHCHCHHSRGCWELAEKVGSLLSPALQAGTSRPPRAPRRHTGDSYQHCLRRRRYSLLQQPLSLPPALPDSLPYWGYPAICDCHADSRSSAAGSALDMSHIIILLTFS